MKTCLYFCYGSNMLAIRLQKRCKSATFFGGAYAEGQALTFSKKSLDGSGKATILRAECSESIVYGTLYEIAESELSDLDRFEGKDYDREEQFIVCQMISGEEVTSTTYIAKRKILDPILKPFDWYKKLVIAGAREGNLPKSYIDWLEEFPSIPDPFIDRKSRIEAMSILGKLDE